MLDGFKPKRRHVKEIPLAPVLDLLTVVVFFLILSTSFDELRQSEVPPSIVTKASAGAQTNEEVPLNPKILVGKNRPGYVQITLKWAGLAPGQIQREAANEDTQYSSVVKDVSKELASGFFKKYPNEKSIQLGFASLISFQTILSCLDGVLSVTKDIALLSFQETEALLSGRQP